MMFYTFTVKDKDYNLRLTVRNTIALEKKIGKNPIMIFGNGDTIPTMEEMVSILHYSLIDLNHNITMEDTYSIFQNWLDDGHIITDFIPVIIEIYKVSGVIKANGEEEKN